MDASLPRLQEMERLKVTKRKCTLLLSGYLPCGCVFSILNFNVKGVERQN